MHLIPDNVQGRFVTTPRDQLQQDHSKTVDVTSLFYINSTFITFTLETRARYLGI